MRYKLLAEENREKPIQDELRFICKDGRIKWISLKTQVMPGDDGTPYFYGFLVDITDEKLAQERVRELYEKELTYFAQAASLEGSIQGRVNVAKDRVESYQAIAVCAIARTGDT